MSRNLPGGLRRYTKTLSQDSLCPGVLSRPSCLFSKVKRGTHEEHFISLIFFFKILKWANKAYEVTRSASNLLYGRVHRRIRRYRRHHSGIHLPTASHSVAKVTRLRGSVPLEPRLKKSLQQTNKFPLFLFCSAFSVQEMRVQNLSSSRCYICPLLSIYLYFIPE
jgi:hypothetical protein